MLAAAAPLWTDVATFCLAVAVFLATVWNIVYVHIQTGNLTRQTTLLSDSIKLTQNAQRPWVGLKSVEAHGPESTARISVDIQNAGNGPALCLQLRGGQIIKEADHPLTTEDIESNLGALSSETCLLPGHSIHWHITRAVPESMHLRIHVFGNVTYTDVFNNPRTTKFARYFDPVFSTWLHDPIYNDMT